jgi:hypothetical protein
MVSLTRDAAQFFNAWNISLLSMLMETQACFFSLLPRWEVYVDATSKLMSQGHPN